MGFKYGRNRLRPSEMDTDAVPIALIMPFPPIPDKPPGVGLNKHHPPEFRIRCSFVKHLQQTFAACRKPIEHVIAAAVRFDKSGLLHQAEML